MIFNLITKAKDIFFNNGDLSINANNVQTALTRVAKQVEKHNEALSDFLIVKGVISRDEASNGTITIGSYAVKDVTFSVKDYLDPLYENYKVLCACSYAINSSTAYVYNFYVDDNGVGHLGIKNYLGSAVTIQPWMYFLLVRDI